MDDLRIVRCDFDNPSHCDAQVNLMREYMTDKMGSVDPLTDDENVKLIQGLKSHPRVLSLLAQYKGEYVGLTNGFVNFATFTVRNFINIHDVIVKNTHRGLGIGKRLIAENIRLAEDEFNCSKITLEVRDDNKTAMALYKSFGFADSDPKMHFWIKKLK